MTDPQIPALRNYQREAITALRAGLLRGAKRQVLSLPTGSGKTVIAAALCASAHAKGKRVAFVCDRVALVRQTSQAFTSCGLRHGVAQGKFTFGRQEPIQVCSAQTLDSRGWWPGVDLVIVDECHVQREKTLKFLTEWNGAAVGLTATPVTPGMGKTWQAVIPVRTTDQLIEQGWIVPLKVFACKEIDMTGARMTAGEWRSSEVEKRSKIIMGDIVSEWVAKCEEHFGGTAKTIVFSATVNHGAEICEAFAEQGYDFRQISYLDKNDELRERTIQAFRRGECDGLVSCEALARGFDVPDVRVLISARPYRRSLAAHIQQLGRVMRPFEGKDYGLVLDHAGNWLGMLDRTLAFFKRGALALDDGTRRQQPARVKKPRKDYICKCGLIMPKLARSCPHCGRERKRWRNYVVRPGGLVQVQGTGSAGSKDLHLWQQVCRIAANRKRHETVQKQRNVAAAYFRNLTGRWPEWGLEFMPCSLEDADKEVDVALRRKWIEWRQKQPVLNT